MQSFRLIPFLFLCLGTTVWPFGSRPALASDVYIRADDNEIGQGVFRRRGRECLVLTPSHVVENALRIELVTAEKQLYKAEVIESFPGDVSVLRVQQGEGLNCRESIPVSQVRLETLLETEKQGELRTLLADGSVRIIPVDIVGFDRYRFIHVTPQDKATILAKGESGSPLYISGQFAGILLSVRTNVGSIMRRDALNYAVSMFFNDPIANPAGKAAPVKDSPPADQGEVFRGVIANSAVAEHRLRLEGNSPLRLSFIATGDSQRFAVEILDSVRRVVFQSREQALSGNESVNLPFTPPATDTYTITILGTRGEGRYAFTLTPIATNAQLRGEANTIAVGGHTVRGQLARGAVAEYRVRLEGNSPIRILLPATGDQLRYTLDVVDGNDRSVFTEARRTRSAGEAVQLPFTPPQDGPYILRLRGVEGEGAFALLLQPIAANAQLRGEGNLITIGRGTVEGIVVQGAVAEHRLNLEAMQPVRLQFHATGDRGLFTVEVVDSAGTGIYLNPSRRYGGSESFAIPITVLNKDQYILRITGIEGECRYALHVQPGR